MRKERNTPEINSSSMADIAFLLLIFFLVTTQFASDKGLLTQLPPYEDEPPEVPMKEREIYKIQINSADKLLVEEEPMEDASLIREGIIAHVLNNGVDPDLSTEPKKAVVSIKADRGTTYERFIEVMDQVDMAYNELYGRQVGITGEEFRSLDMKNDRDRALYDEARKAFPKAVSIAEPTNIGG